MNEMERLTKELYLLVLLMAVCISGRSQCWQWVDPRIGSVGVGRTFPGPSMPFGMVKPGPDCGVLPNAGWAPMPERVAGFSQTHVSGTGGGQKYGNILLQPFVAGTEEDATAYGQWNPVVALPQQRVSETIELGYYATTYASGVTTEITTSERCAHYRFHYPRAKGQRQTANSLFIDATHFLGKDTIPNLRERQQLVAYALEVTGRQEVTGYSSVRGGWNNGDAYTVYFCLQSDKPFLVPTEKVQGATKADRTPTPPSGRLAVCFSDTLLNVKIGISYVSTEQARKNIDTISFDQQLSLLRSAWEQQLRKVSIEGSDKQKRMFYTALYHTMLMPVCKTGENPRLNKSQKGHGGDTEKAQTYYDDYYAIWDTYRTSSPLLTILDPERESEIVNSLLNIYANDGYLPDARSGDCNGRTQGGSNAEVVIADAFVKGLTGIDYELTLQAMLKDGEADPGEEHEKHGRGGLDEYLQLGYIPYGIPRAGTRTIEYAFDDYCISVVARGLGHDDTAQRYEERSRNWRNLWRSDYEWDGMKGYIMPRDNNGQWLDSVVWGHSAVYKPKIAYTPVTKVAPWYIPWWDTFFYEATSQEYSLSVPHDVEGLVEACGGKDAFRRRLDRFFERGYYNVQNEPSFLTPCLYHWTGRPDLSTKRIHEIVNSHYSDEADGLPGNDDSGAMSSWLAFHLMGLYPNAGHDYYLLNVPLLSEYTLALPNSNKLHTVRKGKGMGFGSVLLNGRRLDDARLSHKELMAGGELVFDCIDDATASEKLKLSIAFTLNRQFRTWPLTFCWNDDTLSVTCKQTEYRIPRKTVDDGDGFCWLSPQTDGTVYAPADGTFAFISRRALRQLLGAGMFVYNGITWRLTDKTDTEAVATADADGTRMTVSLSHSLPLVLEMKGNLLGIDWRLEQTE